MKNNKASLYVSDCNRGGEIMYIGGIEAGGTKFVCAVGNEHGKIMDRVSLPTRYPEETLIDVKRFFAKYEINALGVGSFGPIDINAQSQRFGTILNTPKTAWKHYDLLGRLKRDFGVPVDIDTDVNAACLGEYRYGAGKDTESCLYITVGTGIGAGFVRNGRTIRGLGHPEIGHIFVRQHPEDRFDGFCPYHGNCLEGLASGPAIEERYGKKGNLLSDDIEVWEMEAYYLAQAIVNFLFVLVPEKVILGGGVMEQEMLYPMIQKNVVDMVNGYLEIEDVKEFIIGPELGGDQGVVGAMELTKYSRENGFF